MEKDGEISKCYQPAVGIWEGDNVFFIVNMVDNDSYEK